MTQERNWMDRSEEEIEGQAIAKAILAGNANAWNDLQSRYGGVLRRVAIRYSSSTALQSIFSTEDIINGFLTDRVIAKCRENARPNFSRRRFSQASFDR